MKVMYIHGFRRERWNIGDDVYFQGANRLLTASIGEHEIIEADLEMCRCNLENVKKLIGLDIDLIVTVGAPWLYSNFEKSWQVQMMSKLLPAYKNVKKIAFGLGGCSGLTKHYFNNMKALDAAKEVFGEFDLVFSREAMTAQFLELAGVNTHILLDSAVFFPIEKYVKNLNIKRKTERPVFCYFDLENGICAGDFTKNETLRVKQMYKYIVKKYNPIVYCVNEKEVDEAKKIGIEDCRFLWHYEDILPLLASASFVVSARVHQATLSMLLNKKTYVIPFDIRYLCTSVIGVETVFIQPKPQLCIEGRPTFKDQLIQRTFSQIVSKVKEIMNEE